MIGLNYKVVFSLIQALRGHYSFLEILASLLLRSYRYDNNHLTVKGHVSRHPQTGFADL
jgi:hypothetical protein